MCIIYFKPAKKPKVDDAQELLSLFQPPDWLIRTDIRISPYVPQIGDEVKEIVFVYLLKKFLSK